MHAWQAVHWSATTVKGRSRILRGASTQGRFVMTTETPGWATAASSTRKVALTS